MAQYANREVDDKALKPQTKFSPGSKSTNTIIAKGVKNAVEKSVARKSRRTTPLSKVSKSSVALVQSDRFKGYLVSTNAADLHDKELAQKVRQHLQTTMSELGAPLQSDLSIINIDFDKVPFILWAEQNTDFVVMSQSGDHDIAFAYLPSAAIPESPDTKNELFDVDLKKYLASDVPFDFDVYIHMPANKKFIQYIKTGGFLSAHSKENLLKNGVKKLFIKNSQREAFLKYCALHAIMPSMKPYRDEDAA